ncbi:MAG: hypothetical protein R6V56_00500 [Lentisphaeria bacterium]
MALLGVFVLSCTTLSGNALQLETPRRVAAASTRRARTKDRNPPYQAPPGVQPFQ